MSSLWPTLASRASLTLTDAQTALLHRYLDLLLDANTRMNLTRITDRAAAETQHIGDAMTLLPHLPTGSFRLVDVGSGGGVPGIPLAICRPDVAVTLVETTGKKANFLRETAAALGLTNIYVQSTRAEELGHTGIRATFDIATVRAVATLAWLVEWCIPLLKPGGTLLAMKGPRIAEELPAAQRSLKQLGCATPVLHPVEVAHASGLVIVAIRKQSKTDSRYPRPPGLAKGKSL